MSWDKVQSYGRELVSDPLARALLLSVLLHFAGIAGVELGRQLGWWNRSLFTLLANHDLVKEVVKTAEQRAAAERQMLQQRPPPEAELVFMDVDPSQAIAEAPKDAKYYSAHNTQAASRSKDEEKNIPKIDGKQEKVPKVTDVSRPDPKAAPAAPPPEKEHSKAEVMQPAPATPKPAPEQKSAPPKPRQDPVDKGETLMAKVQPRQEASQPQPDNPSTPAPEPKRRRPASVAEAKAQKGLIEGPRMLQHGGARIGITEGLDVRATPFGAYDALFIEAVQSRWFSLLDEREFAAGAGKVVVEFRLHQDGRITDLSVADSSVNELLSWFCQRAILDPAPYRPFPPDLRRMMNSDYREIRFTFYYNQ